jgi:FMN phosphatase YigB (HAD superfamily)
MIRAVLLDFYGTLVDEADESIAEICALVAARAQAAAGVDGAAALTRLGLPAAQVLHVGDSLSADIGGGAAAGLPTAWVNRAGRANPGPHRPDHEVDDLTKLLPLFA